MILVASLFGIAQMIFQHKFYKEMKKLRFGDEVKPFAAQDFSNEIPNKDTTEEVVFLNADENGRHLKGGHHGEQRLKDNNWDRRPEDDHHHGRDHHRGGHCKGMKKFFAVFLWLALVVPFLRYFKRYTVSCIKMHKVNQCCNETQRAEVNRIVVQKLGQANSDKDTKIEKLARKASKFAAKAKKAAEKLAKLTKKAEKEEIEKMAALQQQAVYAPPQSFAPGVDTKVYDMEEGSLLMPPQAPQVQQQATYTLE